MMLNQRFGLDIDTDTDTQLSESDVETYIANGALDSGSGHNHWRRINRDAEPDHDPPMFC